MNAPTEHMDRVAAKAARLVRAYHALHKDNEKLRQELGKKSAAEQLLREQTRQLEQQVQLLKAATGDMDENGRKELQKQLNHYIREIDRCISLLGE
jgi:regulator of replication initiation timing